jgi:hypothetical protein
MPPIDFTRLEFLYEQLWAKKDNPPDRVFRDFEFPLLNTDSDTDTNPQHRRKKGTAEMLSLGHISSGPELQTHGRLPCKANELLVRGAYREMYDILVADHEDRLKDFRAERSIADWKKFRLILGQPGIGKTWFLSYVLVRRLLEGKPTIYQVAKHLGNPVDFTEATHYLINGNGVHLMPDTPSFSVSNNPDIWVLADQRPVGAARTGDHSWLVIVSSSPRKDNIHRLIKEFSAQKYYLPAWDWEEVVAAAYVQHPRLRTSCVSS